jgi:hypothetical protein
MVSIVVANPNNVRLSMAYQQTREGNTMLHTIATDIANNAIAIVFWITLGVVVARRIRRGL